MSRPHVGYITPMFGYPPVGGPRLRTYYTLRALSSHADISLYVTQQPDTANRAQAREHLLGFCRDVVFPPAPPKPSQSLLRRAAVGDAGGHTRQPDPRRGPARGQSEYVAQENPRSGNPGLPQQRLIVSEIPFASRLLLWCQLATGQLLTPWNCRNPATLL